MRYLRTIIPLLLAPFASAQSESTSGSAGPMTTGTATDGQAYLQQVLGALTAANLTGLVGVASAIANTTEGMALLGQLSIGNKTVFAPNNEAFSAVPQEIASNTSLLTTILSYHILTSSYSVNTTAVAPNHTIARSLLMNEQYMLPGNRSAPVVLARNSSDAMSFQIVQAASNVSTMGPAVAANLQVYIIDAVLDLPPTVTDAATALLPSLAGVIQQAGLSDALANSEGITVFAPADSAINAAMGALGMLNQTQVQGLLANHVINGSVVYSTGLGSGNYTSAGGSPFMFITNDTGSYVMSGESTARIVQSDVIIANGVVHVIDGVLVNTNANPDAASSAYSSAVAAATIQSDPATPQTSSPSGTGGSGSGGTSSTSGAAGKRVSFGINGGSLIGGAIAVGAAVLGGTWVLM